MECGQCQRSSITSLIPLTITQIPLRVLVSFNSISLVVSYTFFKMLSAKKLGGPGQFICMHNILKAHAKIYHMYNREFRQRQNGQIGLTIACSGAFPKTVNDTAAVDAYFKFDCGWVANPIFSRTGDYPEIVKSHVACNSKLAGFSKSFLPKFSPKWVQQIK